MYIKSDKLSAKPKPITTLKINLVSGMRKAQGMVMRVSILLF